MHCGLQSGLVPVWIPISLRSWTIQSAGGWQVLSWVHSLTPSKWIDGAVPFRANSRKRSALLHIWQIPGKVNLNLIKARSELSGPWYLEVLPDPAYLDISFTQRTSKWHFLTCMEHPLNNWSSVTFVPCYILTPSWNILGFYVPLPLQGGQYVTCNIMSALSCLDYDLLSICDQPAQNCAILTLHWRRGARSCQLLRHQAPFLG
jgi:hypothetical protein